MENQQHNPPKTSKVWTALQHLEQRINHQQSVITMLLKDNKYEEVDEAKFEDDEFMNRFNPLAGMYAFDMKNEKIVKINYLLEGWEPVDEKNGTWFFEHPTKGKQEIKAEDMNDAGAKLREKLKRGSSISVVKS